MAYPPRPATNPQAKPRDACPAGPPPDSSAGPAPGRPGQDTEAARPATAYQADARVWVWRTGRWRPGVAIHDGGHGLLVRYRLFDDAYDGTAVDTVPAACIRQRAEPDPVLDRPATPTQVRTGP